MRRDMICPECGAKGFCSKAVWDPAGSLKCFHCGEWSNADRWTMEITLRWLAPAHFPREITVNSKKLASAVREKMQAINDISEDVVEPGSKYYDDLNDTKTLLGVLAHIVDGMPVGKAFGSPGDWGYGTPIGKAIANQDNGHASHAEVES